MLCHRMMKKTYFLPYLLVLLSIFCCKEVAAQYLAPKFALHLTNPLSAASKIGLRAQFRLTQENSFLLGYKQYYNFFPGYQITGEFHRYFHSFDHSEAFYYFKGGMGKSIYKPRPYYSGWEDPYSDPGTYVFFGAGAGKRYNFGPFFVEGNIGLKLAQLYEEPDNYNRNLFYSLGPGSLIDFNFHVGYQFYREARRLKMQRLRRSRPTRY